MALPDEVFKQRRWGIRVFGVKRVAMPGANAQPETYQNLTITYFLVIIGFKKMFKRMLVVKLNRENVSQRMCG
jgi:hypothetical protein